LRARDQLISALLGNFALDVLVVMCRLPGPRHRRGKRKAACFIGPGDLHIMTAQGFY
jgi:hypothetical protein